jgi:hypothetical protein
MAQPKKWEYAGDISTGSWVRARLRALVCNLGPPDVQDVVLAYVWWNFTGEVSQLF